ncbi:MAG: UDP-N-acetylmuramate dehydrogenase [Anaerolineae bacterium]
MAGNDVRVAGALADFAAEGVVHRRAPLAPYTALRVGGPAELLVKVTTARALRQAVILARARDLPCRVLGGGSNVLVSDAGLRGLVLLNRAGAITFGPDRVRAESGAALSRLARRCVSRGLAGLEWAVGLPGTVGGAVVGNAGAWGGDVASVLARARVLEANGQVSDWPARRFHFRYRGSALKAPAGPQIVVLDAEFDLAPADRQALEARLAEITARRKASQPSGATCGSVFKNPPGDYAGRLVEAAGLKGTRRGGAMISDVHANFVVNEGSATAADVKALIDLAQRAVQEKFGIALELEIELLGEWHDSASPDRLHQSRETGRSPGIG